MRHSYFEARNFKGIRNVRLDFTARPRSNVYVLVGLNESGKTTVLEALNFFNAKSGWERLDALALPGYTVKDVHDLIPIGERSNFNDAIVLTMGYILDAEDNESIRQYLLRQLNFEMTEDISEFSIQQTYQFTASKFAEKQPLPYWSIKFVGHKLNAKGKRGRKLVELEDDEWQTATSYVKTLLPSVLYFPNFLFEFPDRIYLESTAETRPDHAQHVFYRTVLQDVLDALGENATLQTHVLARAKSGTSPDKRALEAVLLKMASHISKTVFTSWNNIFKRRIGNKEVVVGIDSDEKGLWFLQLRIRDANELYSISERSLGFRWFFAFLLLTQYRGFRAKAPKDVLFLFDEPASNLHPSAQTQLLESFGRFPERTSIIYTTHSHHMINPEWLEGTFVVRNEGLDYDTADDQYSARNTVIALDKYRTFAAQHPDSVTYIQPILDVLDYSPSKLENVPDVVMVEGKNDYYTLKYFQDKVLRRKRMLNLLPGNGSTTLDSVIRLYIAWGRNFIILLDSDSAGKDAKRRYEDRFGMSVRDRIYVLEDIESTWKTKEMERLLGDADRIAIQASAYSSATRFNKTHFNRAIQELYLVNEVPPIAQDTKDNFSKILDFCEQKLRSS